MAVGKLMSIIISLFYMSLTGRALITASDSQQEFVLLKINFITTLVVLLAYRKLGNTNRKF